MKVFFSLCCLLALPLFISSVYAQTQNDAQEMDVYNLDATHQSDPYAGQYQKMTPQSLSKLYWKLQVFDSGDHFAIDNFMLINECQIYQDNFNNDFEWSQIRKAAKKHIQNSRKNYSDKFEFFIPVYLSRYDTEKGGFHLVEDTAFEGVRRLEINGGMQHGICGRTKGVKDYPVSILLILGERAHYTFAKVDEHVAQAYLLRKQEEILSYDFDKRQRRYERIAYLRLRARLEEYQGNIAGKNDDLAVLKGTLEGIELFEDPEGRILLSSIEHKTSETVQAVSEN